MENMLFTTHGDNEPYTLATGAIECDDGIWYKRKGNEGVYATINGKHSNITDDPLLRYNIKIPQAWSTAEMKRMHDLDWPLSFKYVGNDNTSTQNYDQEDTGNLRTYQGKVKRMCLSAVTPLYKKLGSIYDSSRTGYEELELARLLARHRLTVNPKQQQSPRQATKGSRWAIDDNSIKNSPRVVLPHLLSRRVMNHKKTAQRCDALSSSSCEPLDSSRIRYDRLLGVADNSIQVEGFLPQLVPKARRYAMTSKSRTTPRRSTTDKRRMHLEKVRRVYLQTYGEEEPEEMSSSSSKSITDNNELNDPLVAWSDGLDINKLLESPQLSMAPIG
ncbi:hypothetical protein FOL47_003700 [Perkinsus chesapeaki]|uniref:Uncharacterized protein n=1 Tax=Perkinsus chesapeaki TaxID=330153 RepID=A0A7J6M6Y2_PERCH|nr:hypothetical protein FOL47_003700 [Perkinsus chesapeaki]